MEDGKVLTPKVIAGYRVRSAPERPDARVLEIVTRDGEFPFVVTKSTLMRLSDDMRKVVERMAPDMSAS